MLSNDELEYIWEFNRTLNIEQKLRFLTILIIWAKQVEEAEKRDL